MPILGRGRDKALRFTRVVARARSSCVVVEMETIIRGALLVKDYSSEYSSEHIVLEVVDPDMWWRMKSIKNNLAHKIQFTY